MKTLAVGEVGGAAAESHLAPGHTRVARPAVLQAKGRSQRQDGKQNGCQSSVSHPQPRHHP